MTSEKLSDVIKSKSSLMKNNNKIMFDFSEQKTQNFELKNKIEQLNN
eukprot:CAMPEP_0116967648 /NCGR_PEP_ID=MMETSP0467-20121206/50704_1 /TAXON_ID=283647 /ORGANISM="Mesodinium pulex, Strain SPMC105" /LENGTH=46 /DNA_ID= /DNA_START= /DNA_END= /DNA_ORIENTATION=